MIVSITGSRKLAGADVGIVAFEMAMVVRDYKVTEFRFGGALGVDTAALSSALRQRGNTGRPRLVVVVPGLLFEQPQDAARTAKRADEVVELGLRSSDRERYRKRNQHLVDAADMLLAFWNGDDRSGTAMTMRMAERKGIPTRVAMIGGGA